MSHADLASRSTPTNEERQGAFKELCGLIMSERSKRQEEVMEKFRDTFKPPPGEWQAKKWIVILSDDERVRAQVTKILEGEQYFVRAFELGEHAFSSMDAAFYLEDGKVPDLAMLDMYMTEMRGLEFFKELRQRTAYANVPVVMLVRGGDELPAVPFVFSVSEPIDRVKLLEFVQRESASAK
jgi:CheY-like chemotaxis protein